MKLKTVRGSLLLLIIAVVVVGSALSMSPGDAQTVAVQSATHPTAMRPFGDADFGAADAAGESRLGAADLTEPGAVAWGTAAVEIIDTTTHQQVEYPVGGPNRRVKELLPPHESLWTLPLGPPNDLPVGNTLDGPRASAVAAFPGIASTGWDPPDPTHAVGPSHIVTTVNMSLAFYAKDGTLEYSNDLGDAGNPGFFEPLGAGGFTFDPKCFYDHIAGRFVVLALETYGSTEAWITFAVSDDSDPNGTWYKYRTDAVITVGSTTYWWDYPGLGYDADAYYVTGNLFGLSSGGWAGVGFRVIDKTDVLVGDPAVYATLRDGGAGSVQVCQHFGSNLAPFFVSTSSSSSLRIHAITDPTTAPELTSTTVSIPSFSDPFSAPAAGGYTVSLVDSRIMNAHWRDGNLYAAHNISSGGRNFARWYHMDTGSWPSSGAVSLVQSGNIDGGSGIHTWFPAIYSNAVGDVGLVCGSSSSTQRIAVNVTGRTSADPLGTMGSLTEVLLASVDGGDRWGDYYDIAIDPADDFTFPPLIFTGPGPGLANPPEVRVWNATSLAAPVAQFTAYGVSQYGVNVAAGDIDGDGEVEIITGAGPGAVFGPHVRGWETDGTAIPTLSYLAYGTNKFGVNVAAGDINGDGTDEIITGAGPGAVFGPHVRGWKHSGGTVTPMTDVSFFAYGTLKYGVNVSCGDVDGDGIDEIITGAGPGAVFGPHVRGWNYDGMALAPISGINFFAYGTPRWGVNVACGDLDGDGRDEMITGPGPGVIFGPQVRGWQYADGSTSPLGGVNFFAYQETEWGARVGAGDLDNDGIDEILTAPGPGSMFGCLIRGWNVDGGNATAITGIDFQAYEGTVTHGGNTAGVR